MTNQQHGEVTRLLRAVERKEAGAENELFQLVYQEVRRIAGGKIKGPARRPVFDATELVGEAYLRLFGHETIPPWTDRGHFYCTIAMVMRNILVDRARHDSAECNGGKVQHVPVDGQIQDGPTKDPADMLAVDDALKKLESVRPPAAKVFMLEHFAGLKHEDVATALGMSQSTVRRQWKFAMGFLTKELETGAS